ncbi:hypothetical protein ACFLQN_04320 [Candidatus Aenigmatarchaeota archaeon]
MSFKYRISSDFEEVCNPWKILASIRRFYPRSCLILSPDEKRAYLTQNDPNTVGVKREEDLSWLASASEPAKNDKTWYIDIETTTLPLSEDQIRRYFVSYLDKSLPEISMPSQLTDKLFKVEKIE